MLRRLAQATGTGIDIKAYLSSIRHVSPRLQFAPLEEDRGVPQPILFTLSNVSSGTRQEFRFSSSDESLDDFRYGFETEFEQTTGTGIRFKAYLQSIRLARFYACPHFVGLCAPFCSIRSRAFAAAFHFLSKRPADRKLNPAMSLVQAARLTLAILMRYPAQPIVHYVLEAF